MAYWHMYPRYVFVGEKRAKAERKLKQWMKKNSQIKPVHISGRILATTWWGKSWNKNLERYADYTNRIGRGRSYVRHGAVLDLQIKPGKVTALVQGSESKPYTVAVKIKAIPAKSWKNIKNVCKGKIHSLKKLLIGQFPKALEEIFTEKGKGLFPAPCHTRGQSTQGPGTDRRECRRGTPSLRRECTRTRGQEKPTGQPR